MQAASQPAMRPSPAWYSWEGGSEWASRAGRRWVKQSRGGGRDSTGPDWHLQAESLPQHRLAQSARLRHISAAIGHGMPSRTRLHVARATRRRQVLAWARA